ncbi:MAG: hypothetical protein JWP97_2692 [Labilithrix sp.]|nr:hypothetical protein [Labilithrix sp.]
MDAPDPGLAQGSATTTRNMTNARISRSLLAAASFLTVASVAPVAGALPETGALRPATSVVDADDRRLDLRAVNGKPMLILYEDKDSAKLNVALKDDLARLARGGQYKEAVALVPVADVQGYDYWPIRGFVKDAIRSESRKVGATIYCDWDGVFQRAAGIRRGTSTVVVIGRDARVRLAIEGQLSTAQREQVISLLKSEVAAGS